MRKILFLILIFASFAAIGVQNANACSCAGPGSPCESYGGATAVFVGTVIGYSEHRVSKEVARREVDWLPRIFKFSVEQSYLGVDGAEIEISTGTGGGDCGYEFKNGQRYLVYAYRYNERLTTNICTRTKPFSSANEDLGFLGNLSSAAAGVTIYGEVRLETRPKEKPAPLDSSISLTIERENFRKEIRLDERGRYRLSGLPQGKFKVKLQLPDTLTVYQPEREVTVADRGCASVVYYVTENGRVSGRVFDVDGQLVPNIQVSVLNAETVDPTTSVKSTRTDEEGRYSFSGLPHGKYIIAVNFTRFPDPKDSTNAYPRAFYPGVTDRPHAETITLGSGSEITDRDIRLHARRPASVVQGQVVWADGTVTKASVSAKDVTHNESVIAHVIETDEQGRFRIEGYVGQKLIIEARGAQVGTRSSAERIQITLARSVEPVKIVITKLR